MAFELRLVSAALERSGGRVRPAARELGISHTQVQRFASKIQLLSAGQGRGG